MEEEARDKTVATPSPLPEKKIMPWTTKEVEQAIKLDSTQSITAEHETCTVDFFFPLITGNETKNSHILILLYCYRTTLLEVLQ